MLSFRYLLAGCILLNAATLASAAEPETIPSFIETETLVALGQGVFDTELYKDNYFQYEERVEELTTQAHAMVGSSIELTAQVRRVTPVEVIIEVVDAGRMRMVLRHDTAPLFGNLGTRWYGGPPSTQRAFVFSKPVGLRIGSEIDLELAKVLRRGDMLTIAGTIEQVPIRIKHVFEPSVAAIVTSWQVTGVTSTSDSDARRY